MGEGSCVSSFKSLSLILFDRSNESHENRAAHHYGSAGRQLFTGGRGLAAGVAVLAADFLSAFLDASPFLPNSENATKKCPVSGNQGPKQDSFPCITLRDQVQRGHARSGGSEYVSARAALSERRATTRQSCALRPPRARRRLPSRTRSSRRKEDRTTTRRAGRPRSR